MRSRRWPLLYTSHQTGEVFLPTHCCLKLKPVKSIFLPCLYPAQKLPLPCPSVRPSAEPLPWSALWPAGPPCFRDPTWPVWLHPVHAIPIVSHAPSVPKSPVFPHWAKPCLMSDLSQDTTSPRKPSKCVHSPTA